MATTFANARPKRAPTPARKHTGLNDDDLYVVNLQSMEVVTSHANTSPEARNAKYNGIAVKPGQGLVKGSELRHILEARDAC